MNLLFFIRSETLQQLLKLGVNLYKWDGMDNVLKEILPLDFDKDMKEHIL